MTVGEPGYPTRMDGRAVKHRDLYPPMNPRGPPEFPAPRKGVGQPSGSPPRHVMNDLTEFFLNLKEDTAAIP